MENISQERAEELFNEFSDYIFKTAYVLTQSQILADDITQESLIRIYKHYHTYDKSKPIKPWIYKIVLNTFRELKRRQKWLIFKDFLPENEENEHVKFEDELIKKEIKKELLDAIRKLPSKNREVVILYYFEDFSLKEISEILSIPLGTCKSRLHYSIKKLNKSCKQNLLWIGGHSYET
ncbi:MAG TPA: RNA polymerase sigma factor [Rummeliibacillus sp.]|nr:RNA polymerase sigma factor [Rummeliibacillus sp.]